MPLTHRGGVECSTGMQRMQQAVKPTEAPHMLDAPLYYQVPGRGTSWVPSVAGMMKSDSQMGEFSP